MIHRKAQKASIPAAIERPRLRVRQATSVVNARAGDTDLALSEPSLQ